MKTSKKYPKLARYISGVLSGEDEDTRYANNVHRNMLTVSQEDQICFETAEQILNDEYSNKKADSITDFGAKVSAYMWKHNNEPAEAAKAIGHHEALGKAAQHYFDAFM